MFDSATFPTAWVANLGLRTLDYDVLRSKDWINDSIYAALKLLKQQFAYIDGFQDTHCGPNSSFRVLPLDGRYVQILHADGSLYPISTCLQTREYRTGHLFFIVSFLKGSVSI